MTRSFEQLGNDYLNTVTDSPLANFAREFTTDQHIVRVFMITVFTLPKFRRRAD